MNVGSTAEKPREQPTKDSDALLIEDVKGTLVKEGLKPEKADRVVQRIAAIITAEHHVGPLPTVKTFEGYERVCKGSARDIVDMAIRQQKHINSVEKIHAYAGLVLPLFGMLAAVCVIGMMVWAAFQLAMDGHEWIAGVVIAGTSFAAIVGQFLQRDRKPAATVLPEAPRQKRKRA